MAEQEVVPCIGRDDRNCLCDGCLDHKLLLLRQASPSLQLSILQHLPPSGHAAPANPPPPRSPPPPPHSPPRQQASPSRTNPMHQARASSPTASGPAPRIPTASTSSPPTSLFQHSLFSIPLFNSNVDAQFDSHSHQNRNRTYRPDDIVIPPLVRERIPNIEGCIRYVLSNSKITGPRKEAAIVESIEEVLEICENIIRKNQQQPPLP